MNILNPIVIPPSPEHAALLNLIQIITLLVFLPFTGMLLGGSMLSVFFSLKAIRTGENIYARFACDIMRKLSVNRITGYILGVIPIVTITLVYAQFLFDSTAVTVNLLYISIFLYIAAVVFLYNYRSFFTLNSAEAPRTGQGIVGIFFLLFSLFVFITSTTIAQNPESWSGTKSILYIIIAGPVILNFLFFVISSFAISSGAILYFFFIWQGGIKEMESGYAKLIRKYSVTIAMISSLLQPVFIFLWLLILPKFSVSPSIYINIGFTLLSILITCNLLYIILKSSDTKYAGAVFYIIFITFTFLIVKDQIAFGNAIKEHMLTVYQKAEEISREKTANVVTSSGVNGEEIYNSKCSACHRFDQKLVGPPYKETVPKYNGDVKKLSAFIYNPVKVNPDYPAMPNQGLKKKEAEAVAQFLMTKVGNK